MQNSPVKGWLSLFQRLVHLITAPETAFQAVKKEPDFLLPTLFILLMAFSSLYGTNFYEELMVRQFPELPMTETTSPYSVLSILTTTITSLLLWIVKTLFHYGMAILLGGEGTFKKTLSIIGYTYFPSMLQAWLTNLTIIFFQTPITLGLGLLLPVTEQYFTVKGLIFSSINIFSVALIILMTVGLSVAMNISKKRALFITLFFWIISQGIAIGSAALSFRFLERI